MKKERRENDLRLTVAELKELMQRTHSHEVDEVSKYFRLISGKPKWMQPDLYAFLIEFFGILEPSKIFDTNGPLVPDDVWGRTVNLIGHLFYSEFHKKMTEGKLPAAYDVGKEMSRVINDLIGTKNIVNCAAFIWNALFGNRRIAPYLQVSSSTLNMNLSDDRKKHVLETHAGIVTDALRIMKTPMVDSLLLKRILLHGLLKRVGDPAAIEIIRQHVEMESGSLGQDIRILLTGGPGDLSFLNRVFRNPILRREFPGDLIDMLQSDLGPLGL